MKPGGGSLERTCALRERHNIRRVDFRSEAKSGQDPIELAGESQSSEYLRIIDGTF